MPLHVTLLLHVTLYATPRDFERRSTWLCTSPHVTLYVTPRDFVRHPTWLCTSLHVTLYVTPRDFALHSTWLCTSLRVTLYVTPGDFARHSTRQSTWLCTSLHPSVHVTLYVTPRDFVRGCTWLCTSLYVTLYVTPRYFLRCSTWPCTSLHSSVHVTLYVTPSVSSRDFVRQSTWPVRLLPLIRKYNRISKQKVLQKQTADFTMWIIFSAGDVEFHFQACFCLFILGAVHEWRHCLKGGGGLQIMTEGRREFGCRWRHFLPPLFGEEFLPVLVLNFDNIEAEFQNYNS